MSPWKAKTNYKEGRKDKNVGGPTGPGAVPLYERSKLLKLAHH